MPSFLRWISPVMYSHGYPFDPRYGLTLDDLLRIEAPPPPDGLADFWRDLHRRARAVDPAPTVRELATPRQAPRRVFEVRYRSLGGADVGAWLSLPRDGEIRRAVVVGHGYGGRDGPDEQLQLADAALLFPCARGIALSACAQIPADPMRHVLHGIEGRERYVLGGCAADLVWCAASVLQLLHPQAAGCLDYVGISFSGGIGALALPWDERFRRLHLSVPTFGHHPWRLRCPCVGSGEAVRQRQACDAAILGTITWFDAACTARHEQRPALVAAALFDPAVPPPGQFAVYNALGGPKELFVLESGHFAHPGSAAEEARLLDAITRFLAPA